MTPILQRIDEHPLPHRVLAWGRFHPSPAHRVPRPANAAVATIAGVVLSLLADAALVAIGTAIFPSTSGYQHFQFGDYALLTVLGVLAAGIGWPIVVRVSSAPRWIFLRLAVLVSVVLLLPDVAIWLQGQPGRAVAILALMHLAIAVVTYNVLVRVAPPRAAPVASSAARLPAS